MKKRFKLILPIFLSLLLLVGVSTGCTQTETDISSKNKTIGEILDPAGNPFPHRFDVSYDSYIELEDTPSSYTGNAYELLRVDSTPDAVEFTPFGEVWVAASTASDGEKAKALASGGAVCDQTDDEVEIQAAINAADDTGKKVRLTAGRFDIETSDLTVTTLLEGATNIPENLFGTYFVLSANRTITLQHPGELRHAHIRRGTSAGAALHIEVTDATGVYKNMAHILHDVYVTNYDGDNTGTGIYVSCINAAGGSDRYIWGNSFGDISVEGFEYGIHIYTTENVSEGFINGNTFHHIESRYCTYPVYIDGDSGAEVSGNRFLIDMQPEAAVTADGVTLVDYVQYNYFNMISWDWSVATGYAIKLSGAYVQHNIFEGDWAESLDIGTGYNNTFISDMGYRFDHTFWNSAHGIYRYGVAGEDVVLGDLCYLKAADGKYWETDADVEATTTGMLAVAMETIAADATGMFLLHGFLHEQNLSFNDVPLFVSTTKSEFQEAAPNGANDVVRIAGFGTEDTRTIYFCPDGDWYLHDGAGINEINGEPISP